MQQAFHEHHGLQCGFCTPGMVMAAVSFLEENPRPDRARRALGLEGNLCRCTGYHNIVKAVLAAAADGESTMTAVTSPRRVLGQRTLRKEDPPLLTGEARFVDDLVVPGALHMRIVRSQVAHATIVVDRHRPPPRRCPASIAVFTGADLRRRLRRAAALRVAGHRGHEAPAHWPLASTRCASSATASRSWSPRRATAAEDAAEAVVVDYDDAAGRRSTSRTRRPTRTLVHADLGTNTLVHVGAHARSRRGRRRVRDRRAHREGALRAAAPHPDGDGAARRVRRPGAVRRRLHDLLVDADPAHPQDLHGDRHRASPSTSCGSSRPRSAAASGRSSTSTPRRRSASRSAKRLGRPVRWTEERSENALGDGPGPRHDPGHRARGRRRRAGSPRCACTCSPTWARTCSSSRPASRCSARSSTTASTTSPRTRSRAPACSRTGRPPTRTAAPGRPEATYAIERAIDALAREIGVDPAEIRRRNFIAHGRSSRTHPRPDSCSTPATTSPRSTGRSRSSATTTLRAEQRERRVGAASHEAARYRACRRYVEMCGLAPSRVLASLRYVGGGWEAATVRVLPTGKVQVVTGIDAARPGPRDLLVDDRRRQARRPHRRHRRAALRHRDRAASVSTPTARGRRRSAAPRCTSRRDQVLDKARAIAAHQLESAEDDLEYVDARVPREGHADACDGARRDRVRGVHRRTTCPTAWSPNLEAQVAWDPPNFTFPFGVHVAVVEIDEETGRVELRALRRGRRLRQPDEPARSSRARSTAASCRASRRRSGRRRSTTTSGNLLHRVAARVPRAVGRRDAELRARPHRHAQPDEPAGREGHRRGGDDRVDARGHERGRRRALAVRHHRHRHAGDPGTGVGRDTTHDRRTRSGGAHDPRGVRVRPRRLGRPGRRAASPSTATTPSSSPAGMSLIPLMKLRLATPVGARRRRPGRATCRTCATTATTSRSAR